MVLKQGPQYLARMSNFIRLSDNRIDREAHKNKVKVAQW